MEKNHHFKLFSIIFFTGAVVLSLELLASRILTPFFGVSLYIWTAILSVTLIFLAIGYQLGGWLTSKINFKYYEELFFFIPFVSSISIVISIITYSYFIAQFNKVRFIIGMFYWKCSFISCPISINVIFKPNTNFYNQKQR